MATKNLNSPDYWRRYDSSGINNPLHIFRVILQLLKDEPFSRNRRGRPMKASPSEYCACLILMSCFGWTFRELEGMAETILGRQIDFTTFCKVQRKIPPSYLQSMIQKIAVKLRRILDVKLLMIDSTGISCDRNRRVSISLKKEVVKLSVIASYCPERSALVIENSSVGPPASDNKCLIPLLHEGLPKLPFLADRGYDDEPNFKALMRLGIPPLIKQRRWSGRGYGRMKARNIFDEAVYCLRGIVETLFAGIQNRLKSLVRMRTWHARAVFILGVALAHNIRTLMRQSLICFYMINSTNSYPPDNV
ncbi:MAG: transposase [Candidatus Micrarchaeia archaeon]